MFRRFIDYLMGAPGIGSSAPTQSYVVGSDEFSIESLWDDYERRSWSYKSAEASLRNSNPRVLNWIGSVDHSGHTREKCLRWLIANREPGDENRILLRLTDWVSQVQVVAREWVLEHFRALPIEAILANQRLILYLSRKARLQSDEGMRAIERDLLHSTMGMTPEEFLGFIPMFRRYLFLLSMAGDGKLRPWILVDPEPFNRLLLLNEVGFSHITDDEMQRLRADKSIFVRRRFFYEQLKAGMSPKRDELVALAVDSIRSLRELGQYYLKSIYGEDAYAMYRGLDGDKFYYIADYARPEDAEHFLDGIRSGSRLTQHNCLRALVSSSPERLRDLDISDLIRHNRKFRSVLIPLLPQLLSVDEILALRPAFEASSPQGTLSFFAVLDKKSFWTFLDEGLADLLADPAPGLRELIIQTIHGTTTVPALSSSRLRDRINKKVSDLRDAGRGRNERLAELIEFTTRTA